MSKVENKLINADLVWTVAAILALAGSAYMCSVNDLPASSLATSFAAWSFVLCYRGYRLIAHIAQSTHKDVVVDR